MATSSLAISDCADAQKGNCTRVAVLSAEPLDGTLLQSEGEIKVSGRHFTRFQRKTDDCDLEPLLKGVLSLKSYWAPVAYSQDPTRIYFFEILI